MKYSSHIFCFCSFNFFYWDNSHKSRKEEILFIILSILPSSWKEFEKSLPLNEKFQVPTLSFFFIRWHRNTSRRIYWIKPQMKHLSRDGKVPIFHCRIRDRRKRDNREHLRRENWTKRTRILFHFDPSFRLVPVH